ALLIQAEPPQLTFSLSSPQRSRPGQTPGPAAFDYWHGGKITPGMSGSHKERKNKVYLKKLKALVWKSGTAAASLPA
ncbi:MAG: hypothetical protein SOY30_12545, partial [Eubacteriales bacterium]|nr:hypothetical protein [Eubacteriales bacterium]